MLLVDDGQTRQQDSAYQDEIEDGLRQRGLRVV